MAFEFVLKFNLLSFKKQCILLIVYLECVSFFYFVFLSYFGIMKKKIIFNNRTVSSQDVKNFFSPKVTPRSDSQSSLLTKKQENHLYKIQCKLLLIIEFSLLVKSKQYLIFAVHQVKPEALRAYKKLWLEFTIKKFRYIYLFTNHFGFFSIFSLVSLITVLRKVY